MPKVEEAEYTSIDGRRGSLRRGSDYMSARRNTQTDDAGPRHVDAGATG